MTIPRSSKSFSSLYSAPHFSINWLSGQSLIIKKSNYRELTPVVALRITRAWSSQQKSRPRYQHRATAATSKPVSAGLFHPQSFLSFSQLGINGGPLQHLIHLSIQAGGGHLTPRGGLVQPRANGFGNAADVIVASPYQIIQGADGLGGQFLGLARSSRACSSSRSCLMVVSLASSLSLASSSFSYSDLCRSCCSR